LYIGVRGTVESQPDEAGRRSHLGEIRRVHRPDGAGIGSMGNSFWEGYVLSREVVESMRLFLFRISALPLWEPMVWKGVPTKQKKASSHFSIK
jgi:hypothetical protein